VGLSRWGAEKAIEVGIATNSLPVLKLINLLKTDLGDNVLNGHDKYNQVIRLVGWNNLALTTNTLRWDLAVSIDHWLSNIPLNQSNPGHNTTSLTSDPYSSRNGFFDMLTTDTSQLFGDDPAHPYDRTGPAISIISPITNHIYTAPFYAYASATDDVGVLSLTASVIGGPADAVGDNEIPWDSAYVKSLIDTHKLSDGVQTIRFTGVDTLGNSSQVDVRVLVDQNPPQVSLLVPAVTTNSTLTLSGTASDVVGIDKVVVFVDGTSQTRYMGRVPILPRCTLPAIQTLPSRCGQRTLPAGPRNIHTPSPATATRRR